jgi:hypothetical protein
MMRSMPGFVLGAIVSAACFAFYAGYLKGYQYGIEHQVKESGRSDGDKGEVNLKRLRK